MKKVFQNFYWIIGFVVAFAGLIVMYLMLDTETVEASNRFYNCTLLSDSAYCYCEEIGEQFGIAPELLMAIAEAESTGDPKATNGGCKGLMQVSTSCHEERMNRLGVSDITDEYGNILVATDYLLELFEEYEDVGLILSLYHGERDAYAKYEAGKLSKYAEKILERAAEITETRDRVRNAVG